MSENLPSDILAVQNNADISEFCNYLKRNVCCLIEDNDDTPKSLHDAIKDSESIECIKKFISDPKTTTLFIQRISIKGLILIYIYIVIQISFPVCITDDNNTYAMIFYNITSVSFSLILNSHAILTLQ